MIWRSYFLGIGLLILNASLLVINLAIGSVSGTIFGLLGIAGACLNLYYVNRRRHWEGVLEELEREQK